MVLIMQLPGKSTWQLRAFLQAEVRFKFTSTGRGRAPSVRSEGHKHNAIEKYRSSTSATKADGRFLHRRK